MSEEKAMILCNSIEGNEYTGVQLRQLSTNELIDLIIILNIKLDVAQQEIDRLKEKSEEMSLSDILRITAND